MLLRQLFEPSDAFQELEIISLLWSKIKKMKDKLAVVQYNLDQARYNRITPLSKPTNEPTNQATFSHVSSGC